MILLFSLIFHGRDRRDAWARVNTMPRLYHQGDEVESKEVAMREDHLAVSAAQGFYLLIYIAPLSIDKAQRPVFRRLVEKDFKPKL